MQHSELFQLIQAYPLGMFVVFAITLFATERIVSWPFRLVNRYLRSRNIAARGWPPEYLDADGDLKKEPEVEA